MGWQGPAGFVQVREGEQDTGLRVTSAGWAAGGRGDGGGCAEQAQWDEVSV